MERFVMTRTEHTPAPPSPTPPRSAKKLARVQAYSGLVFALFLTLHLAELLTALGGQQRYDALLRTLRQVYQWPLVEGVVVLGAALVHMSAAILRVKQRRRKQRRASAHTPLRIRLHRYSGYFLWLAFAGHVLATRIPSLLGERVDFAFLTFTLRALPAVFYPYYSLLAMAGVYHLGHGTLAALRMLGLGGANLTAPRNRLFWLLAAAVSALGVMAVVALGGGLFAVDTTSFMGWEAFYRRFLGRWAPTAG